MNAARREGGFSLIELVTAIAIITVGLGSLYGVVHCGLAHMRIVSSRNYAVIAVASELETVKAMPFGDLPKDYAGPFMGRVDLSPLPDARATLRIRERRDSGGRLRIVTATVKWRIAGKQGSYSASTMVAKP